MIQVSALHVCLRDLLRCLCRSKSSHADWSNQIKINLTGVLYANMLLQVRLTKDCDMQHVSVRNQKTFIAVCCLPAQSNGRAEEQQEPYRATPASLRHSCYSGSRSNRKNL